MINISALPRHTFHYLLESTLRPIWRLCSYIRDCYQSMADFSLKLLLSDRHWVSQPNSYKGRLQLYAIRFFASQKKELYSCSEILPSLPVPDLNLTVEKHLRSLKPFMLDSDFKDFERAAQEFLKTRGPVLQQKLLAYAADKRNWLEQIWVEQAYLKKRESALLTSWFALDRITPLNYYYAPLPYRRAARILYRLLSFREELRAQRISPCENGIPICQEQFKNIFGANRLPGSQLDKFEVHSDSKHVIVLMNNHIYKMDVIDDDNRLISEAQILARINQIFQDATSQPKGVKIASLTLLPRAEWSIARNKLEVNNSQTLDSIDRALLALRLSDKQFQLAGECRTGIFSQSSLARELIAEPKDLWIDKGITLTAASSGSTGFLFEHTMGDATPITAMLEWVYDKEATCHDDFKQVEASTAALQRLEWILSADDEEMIKLGRIAATELASSIELNCTTCSITGLGKKKIQQWGFSPDSFVQMAFQYAYYLNQGKIPFTYESASTRGFYHGRTETIRSASEESLHFCKTMVDANATKEQKQQALKKAIEVHVAYKYDAVNGMGCDRHLLGLKVMAGDEGDPFLNDPRGNPEYMLSTSQTGVLRGGGGGFLPASNNGFGISYHILDHKILINMSQFQNRNGYKLNLTFLESNLHNALGQMWKLYHS